jgi:hypothetical protein
MLPKLRTTDVALAVTRNPFVRDPCRIVVDHKLAPKVSQTTFHIPIAVAPSVKRGEPKSHFCSLVLTEVIRAFAPPAKKNIQISRLAMREPKAIDIEDDLSHLVKAFDYADETF